MEIKKETVEMFYKFVSTMDGRPTSGPIENIKVEVDENEPEYSTIIFTSNDVEEYMPLNAYNKIEEVGFEGYLNFIFGDIQKDIDFCNGVIDLSSKYETDNSKRLANMVSLSLSPMQRTVLSLKDYIENKKWL